jgi:hypothetical protein
METHSRAKVKHFLHRATRAMHARVVATRAVARCASRSSTHEIRALRRYHVRNAR